MIDIVRHFMLTELYVLFGVVVLPVMRGSHRLPLVCILGAHTSFVCGIVGLVGV